VLPLHRWVPWIAGFSSQFVEDCFNTFIRQRRWKSSPCILDPFAGVGTTLVEALLNGFNTIGFEINPYATLACKVKLNAARFDAATLEDYCGEYRRMVAKKERPITTSRPEAFRTRTPFFSRTVEKQVLTFFDFVNFLPDMEIADLFRVAFGSVMVSFSNYTYEPSLGSRPGAGKPLVDSADVHSAILGKLQQMIIDIRWVKERLSSFNSGATGQVHNLNFLEAAELVPENFVDLVVTSPPYMNNYHYVRNTRPQLFWLSLVSSPKDLRSLEEANFGKYWQTVRDSEPVGLMFDNPDLANILVRLRETRKENGAYGGPGWANYLTTYFNDCFRFLAVLKQVLRRRGAAVVVIGNSIIQGHEIKTDVVLAEIASQIGLELKGVQLIRTKRVGSSITQSTVRRGHPGRATLYDSAVILQKR
jgi:DNA modification methylase